MLTNKDLKCDLIKGIEATDSQLEESVNILLASYININELNVDIKNQTHFKNYQQKEENIPIPEQKKIKIFLKLHIPKGMNKFKSQNINWQKLQKIIDTTIRSLQQHM